MWRVRNEMRGGKYEGEREPYTRDKKKNGGMLAVPKRLPVLTSLGLSICGFPRGKRGWRMVGSEEEERVKKDITY